MISPEPLDNAPRLPFPALPSSGALGFSASGRLQTHLSSFNSERRLRNLPSVTEDLEKQDDLDPGDSDDRMDNDDNKQLVVKRRFVWLARAFIWFSALFFPISVLGNHGVLRRPSVNRFGRDHEPGPRNCQKDCFNRMTVVARLLTISLGKRAALVKDNHPPSSTITIPLLCF